MKEIAIVYHSGKGHTEMIAQHVAKGAAENSQIHTRLLKVEDIEDPKILNSADAIIFGAPTYMGSLSAPFKAFMDATSTLWYTHDWCDKLAAGFTNSHSMSGDKLNSLLQLVTFSAQHGMVWLSLGLFNESGANDQQSGDPQLVNRIGSYLGLMSQSDNDEPKVTPPRGDKKTAELLGQRVANWVLRVK